VLEEFSRGSVRCCSVVAVAISGSVL